MEVVVIILLMIVLILVIALVFSVKRNRHLEHYLYIAQRDARTNEEEARMRITELHRELGLAPPSYPYGFLSKESQRAVAIRANGGWDANPDPSG